MSTPGISIVMRTHNCAELAAQVVAALDRGPEDELIVVDSGSTDGTVAALRLHATAIIEIDGGYQPGRSLNAGFARTRNPWILSLSSHVFPMGPPLLSALRGAAARWPEDLACLHVPVCWVARQWRPRAGLRTFGADDLAAGRFPAVGNPACLYPRARWRQHPFDETLSHCEDVEWHDWAARSRLRLGVLDDVAVRYRSRRPLRVFYEKGRNEQRVITRFRPLPPPRLHNLAIQAARLTLDVLTFQVSPASAARFFLHGLGSWREGRAQRASSP